MKVFLSSLATILLIAGSALAQGIFTSGTITAYSRETGQLTLQRDSRLKPLVFQRMNNVPVMLASGEMIPTTELWAGQKATVHWEKAGNHWIVSKVVVAEVAPRVRQRPIQVALPRAERWALTSKAATDRDITTQPGAKAIIDRDITTQPGTKQPWDRDITKKSPDTANSDRDITTHKDR
jgi:hypothetical protein